MEVKWKYLIGIYHTWAIRWLYLLDAMPGDSENAIPEEEMLGISRPALEVWLNDGQIFKRSQLYLLSSMHCVGQSLIIILWMSLDVFEQVSGTITGYCIFIDWIYYIINNLAEGISFLVEGTSLSPTDFAASICRLCRSERAFL